MRPVKRLCLLLLLSLIVAGCGWGSPAVARVNDSTINQTQLNKELRALVDNKLYSEKDPQLAKRTNDETVPAEFAAGWLSYRMQFLILKQIADSNDVEVNDRARAATAARFKAQFGPAFAEWPRWFQKILIEQESFSLALAWAQNGAPTEEQQRQFYDENVQELQGASFDEVAPLIDLVLTQDALGELQIVVGQAVVDSKAKVYGSFGSVDTSQGQFVVTPREAPDPREEPEKTPSEPIQQPIFPEFEQ